MGVIEPKLFLAMKSFIVKDGKVLILRESTRYGEGTQTGNYDVPGGRLKPGEEWSAGLKREVFEETGLQVKEGKPIAVSEWRPVVKGEQWQIVAVFFECFVESGSLKLSQDHDAYLWIDPKDYLNYPMPPKNIPAFEAYTSKK